MKDSAHWHDAKVEKPFIREKFSELVLIVTSDGVPAVAQYGKDGWWHSEGDETFGNVDQWFDGFTFPSGCHIDYSRFGGE